MQIREEIVLVRVEFLDHKGKNKNNEVAKTTSFGIEV
jgi:hypothetical protein